MNMQSNRYHSPVHQERLSVHLQICMFVFNCQYAYTCLCGISRTSQKHCSMIESACVQRTLCVYVCIHTVWAQL